MNRILLSLIVAVIAAPSMAPAQTFSVVDSADAARAAWSAAGRAMRAQDLPAARRLVERANDVWPLQPAYAWNRALLAARAADTAGLRVALNRYAALGLGRDISADSLMNSLTATADFSEVKRQLDLYRAPRTRSTTYRELADSAWWPEGVDVDPRNSRVYLSSVRRRSIAEISPNGRSRELLPASEAGVGAILAVRVDTARGVLWATSSGLPQMEAFVAADTGRASLLQLRLSDGKILRRIDIPGANQVLGDVAISASGDVFVSDSHNPVLHWLRAGSDTLIQIRSPLFRSLQGIAPAPDGRSVFVADYSHGLLRVDLATVTAHWLGAAPSGTPIGLDGIAYWKGSIIAVQNGVQPARVVRFQLNPTGWGITNATVLEQDPRIADEPTAGTIVGNTFIYVANSQWEKRDDKGTLKSGAKLERPRVLALPLLP